MNAETKDELAESFNATVNTFTKITKAKDGHGSEVISVGNKGAIIVTHQQDEGKLGEEGVGTPGSTGQATSTPTKHARSGEIDPDKLILGKELGRGASSYVQLVTEKDTERRLALKVMNVFDKNMRSQLLREFNLLFHCDCDALVKFHGAFYKEGKISVALEYMDRGSLDVVMRKARINSIAEYELLKARKGEESEEGEEERRRAHGLIPEQVLAAITFQCLWGLSYLKHEHRLHRDIKPQNVLLNKQGFVKLTDFGISKELENSIGKCMTIVGTFKYMSPERILGKGYSYPADIWSLGLMLIECATGKYPFIHAGSMIEMAQTVTESEPPKLTPERLYSDSFHDFINACMKNNPADRETAYELLGYKWLSEHNANSMRKCQDIVRDYFQEEKNKKKRIQKMQRELLKGGRGDEEDERTSSSHK